MRVLCRQNHVSWNAADRVLAPQIGCRAHHTQTQANLQANDVATGATGKP